MCSIPYTVLKKPDQEIISLSTITDHQSLCKNILKIYQLHERKKEENSNTNKLNKDIIESDNNTIFNEDGKLQMKIFTWFENLTIEEKIKICTINNKWLVKLIIQLYLLYQEDNEIKFTPLPEMKYFLKCQKAAYQNSNVLSNSNNNFYSFNGYLSLEFLGFGCNNQTIKDKKINNPDRKLDYYANFFEIRKLNNKKQKTELADSELEKKFLNNIILLTLEGDSVDNISLNLDVIKDINSFKNFFMKFSSNECFKDWLLPIYIENYYNFTLPNWLHRNPAMSLCQIIIGFFEQQILINYEHFYYTKKIIDSKSLVNEIYNENDVLSDFFDKKCKKEELLNKNIIDDIITQMKIENKYKKKLDNFKKIRDNLIVDYYSSQFYNGNKVIDDVFKDSVFKELKDEISSKGTKSLINRITFIKLNDIRNYRELVYILIRKYFLDFRNNQIVNELINEDENKMENKNKKKKKKKKNKKNKKESNEEIKTNTEKNNIENNNLETKDKINQTNKEEKKTNEIDQVKIIKNSEGDLFKQEQKSYNDFNFVKVNKIISNGCIKKLINHENEDSIIPINEITNNNINEEESDSNNSNNFEIKHKTIIGPEVERETKIQRKEFICFPSKINKVEKEEKTIYHNTSPILREIKIPLETRIEEKEININEKKIIEDLIIEIIESDKNKKNNSNNNNKNNKKKDNKSKKEKNKGKVKKYKNENKEEIKIINKEFLEKQNNNNKDEEIKKIIEEKNNKKVNNNEEFILKNKKEEKDDKKESKENKVIINTNIEKDNENSKIKKNLYLTETSVISLEMLNTSSSNKNNVKNNGNCENNNDNKSSSGNVQNFSIENPINANINPNSNQNIKMNINPQNNINNINKNLMNNQNPINITFNVINNQYICPSYPFMNNSPLNNISPIMQFPLLNYNYINPSDQFFDLLTKEITAYDKLTTKNIENLNNIRNKYLNLVENLIKTGLQSKYEIKFGHYGSYFTNLSIEGSDLDILVYYKSKIYNNNFDFLKDIIQLLTENEKLFESIRPILSASVPVIILQINIYNEIKNIDFMPYFDDKDLSQIKIDLTFSQSETEYNRSSLIVNYMNNRINNFPLIRPLLLIMKRYFKIMKMNKSYTGGLSSFSLFLLILAYGITFTNNPLLSVGNNSLGKVLYLLIEKYSFFNFKKWIIDVENEKVFYPLSENSLLNEINILDPFTKLNVAKSSFKVDEIKNTFYKALMFLKSEAWKYDMNKRFNINNSYCFDFNYENSGNDFILIKKLFNMK